jgi:glycosyltransferase involved in cell wall biosynthesis
MIASRRHGADAPPPVAWLISYTPAADEPRLVRQASSLLKAGWRVVVCGYEGRSPEPDDWTFISLAKAQTQNPVMPLKRRLSHRLVRSGVLVSPSARIYYHGVPDWHAHFRQIVQAAKDQPLLRPDLIVAHDYLTCPAADALARKYGASVIVDSHEYMLGTQLESADWVAHQRPIIKALQDDFFSRAGQVIAVSQGIVDRLGAEQRTKRPIRLIRNLPHYQELPFRGTAREWVMLYHGIIDPVRNLESAIEAAAIWKAPLTLVLRGPGPPDYIRSLRALVEERGITHRVKIEDPIPYTEMITRANEADIGYFVYADGSPQRKYVLPNKFFEYVMAGLALFVSDLPEMKHLVDRYGLGIAIPEVTPTAIAQAVDRLTITQIDNFKRASLVAAHELCWEREQTQFLEIVHDVCGFA